MKVGSQAQRGQEARLERNIALFENSRARVAQRCPQLG